MRSAPSPSLSTASASMSLTRQKPINFVWGKPAPSLLPVSGLGLATQAVLAQSATATDALEYGDTAGPPALREQVARWLTRVYGTVNVSKEICVTGGASQGLAVVLQVLSDPLLTKRVWLVTPCFHLVSRVFQDAGLTGKLRAIPETDTGIDLDLLEREITRVDSEPDVSFVHRDHESSNGTKPSDPSRKIYSHLIYLVPTFSNPSGRTLPLAQRRQLVALAQRFDALIISDDIYDHLSYDSVTLPGGETEVLKALPRLVDIEREGTSGSPFGHTLSNGSFSKIIGPGVRTGWISASPALVNALANAGASIAGGCPSQFGSAIVAEFMVNDQLLSHVKHTLIPSYARRRALMDSALRDILYPLGARIVDDWENRIGGFYIWLKLPGSLDGGLVATNCAELEKLAVWPGNAFDISGDDRSGLGPYLRLCFSWEDEENIYEGVRRLGLVVQRLLEENAHEGGPEVQDAWRETLWKSNTSSS